MRTTLYFNVKGVSLTQLEVDCTFSETHSGDVEATSHPVEEGADVTDYIRPRPKTYQLEGAITDNPLYLAPDAVDAGEGRSGRALEALEALRDSGGLVRVVSRLKAYDNLILTHLSTPEDSSRGGMVRFSATLQQVRFVSTATARALPGQRKKARTNVPKTEAHQKEGVKVPAPASEPVAARAKSAFVQVGDKVADATDYIRKWAASP